MKTIVSPAMVTLLLIGMITLAFNTQPAEADLETSKAETSPKLFSPNDIRFTRNETSQNKKGNMEQAKIVEHRITSLELEKLNLKIGVCDEGRSHNQIIDGHGTGLRPPTKEEWADIAKKAYVVERILLDQTIPSSVDHTTEPWFPPIGDQDGEGSCTTWAVGYYMKTFQEAKEHEWNLTEAKWEGGYHGYPTPEYQNRIFSPDFIYHLINGGVDGGSSFYEAITLVCDIGVSSWEKTPYNPVDHSSWPSEEAWQEAPLYRGNSSGYEYIVLGTDDGLTSLKNWIASGNLAVIGVDANKYSNLTSQDIWTLDNYVNPSVDHANTIVGYDDNVEYTEKGELRHGAFKIANSWGEGGWENIPDGCYWISYEAMKQRVGYCMFYRDRIGYRPELLSSFRIDHSKRGECNILIGMGNHDNPVATKSFTGLIDGGNFPFCSNNIVFDVTEFKDVVPTLYNQSFFIRVYDGGSVTVGTILAFSINYAVSMDPPITTVNGDKVFADVVLPNTIRVPSDYMRIQEAINAVVLGLNPNPGVTIQVAQGTYHENVVVNKTVSLVAKTMETTIIDGSGVGNVTEVTADNVTIMGFTIRNSGQLLPRESGIVLRHARNCNIFRNNITSNMVGLLLEYSSDNSISGNNITASTYYGVYLDYSSNNSIYHNNLINNTNQVYDYSWDDSSVPPSVNFWDGGYPSGGNYWSDYNGTDLCSGPYQDVTGSDGIGDKPYVIDDKNQDRYPFMNPLVSGVAVISVVPSATEIYAGWTVYIYAMVENNGSFPETFDVFVSCNSSSHGFVIEKQNVKDLNPGENVTLTFTWNTSNLEPCTNYSIRVEASVLPYEVTMENSIYVYRFVKTRMLGDVNGDDKVNIYDVVVACSAYGSKEGDPNWNPFVDLAPSYGIINIYDMVTIIYYFGKT